MRFIIAILLILSLSAFFIISYYFNKKMKSSLDINKCDSCTDKCDMYKL